MLNHKKVEIIYLPAYSLNLNAIKRCWKIVREHTQYNKYHSKFSDFAEEVRDFFNTKANHIKYKIY